MTYIVPHQVYTKDELDYYSYRGITFDRINRTQDRQIIPCRCKHLSSDNKCMIWDTRPDVCNKEKRAKGQAIFTPPGCTDE